MMTERVQRGVSLGNVNLYGLYSPSTIALVPGFSSTCLGTFHIAVFGSSTFGIIWTTEAEKRVFMPAHAVSAFLARSLFHVRPALAHVR